jgi:hypothetical protein
MANEKETINENTIITTHKSRYNYEIIKRMNNRQGIIELERIGIRKPKPIICDPSSGSSGPSPDKAPKNRSTASQPPLRSVVMALQQTVEKLTEEMRAGFKTINTRFDNLIKVNNLKE